MSWLVTLRWVAAVAAATCGLLAFYVADVRDDNATAGVLGFLALFFVWQWFRIKGWQARLDRAKSESSE